jgi:hypothetical protein
MQKLVKQMQDLEQDDSKWRGLTRSLQERLLDHWVPKVEGY